MSNFLTRLLIILLVFLSIAPSSRPGRKSLVSCFVWDDEEKVNKDLHGLMKLSSDLRVRSNDEKVSHLEECGTCGQPFCSSILSKLYRSRKNLCEDCAKRIELLKLAEREKKLRTLANTF